MNLQDKSRELEFELNRIMNMKSIVQKKLVLEEQRLDVLAKILGYEVYPFHWLLIQLKKQLKGPWRMFFAARGSGKSTIINTVDCVLKTLITPDIRILLASSVKEQSKAFLTEIQGCYENVRFCELFGDMKGSKWGAEEATIKTRVRKWKEPTFMTCGADGPVTSKHFNIIKADDLVTEKNSRSIGERDKIFTFFYKTLVPTLIIYDKHTNIKGEIDIIGTRWHVDDLYARAEKNDPEFRNNICSVPVLVNSHTGKMDSEGISTIEELLPSEKLKNLRESMGSANFDSQYQQSIKRLSGDIFKNEYFRYYEDDAFDLVEKLQLKIWAACDLAIGEDTDGDEYADCVIGVDDRDSSSLDVYILELFHGIYPYTFQIARAQYIFDKWDPIRYGIESNAFQKSRLFQVYRELGPVIGERCVPILTFKDKITRAWKLSARYEAGKVFHRKNDKMTNDLEEQLVDFPKGKYDDIFDAVDIAINLGCITRARKRRNKKVGLFGKSKSNYNKRSIRL